MLPLSHVFERQAMYILHRAWHYFAESLQTVGPNLREVRPTVLVGAAHVREDLRAFVSVLLRQGG